MKQHCSFFPANASCLETSEGFLRLRLRNEIRDFNYRTQVNKEVLFVPKGYPLDIKNLVSGRNTLKYKGRINGNTAWSGAVASFPSFIQWFYLAP